MVEGKMMDDEELTSLDEVLGGASETQPETETQPEPEATQETPQAEPEQTEEPEGSTPEPEEEWTKAAVMDERQKRQTMEKELAESRELTAKYEGYFKALQSQQTETEDKPKAPDFWEDPEKAISHMQETLRGEFSEQLNTVNAKHKSALLNMSERMVAQSHEDFDEVKQYVLEIGKTNPAAIREAIQSNPDHPWQAVYDYGVKHMQLSKVGDLESYEQSIKEKYKAELLAEIESDLKAKGQELESVPESLVTETSKGGTASPQWSGPTSLDELL